MRRSPPLPLSSTLHHHHLNHSSTIFSPLSLLPQTPKTTQTPSLPIQLPTHNLQTPQIPKPTPTHNTTYGDVVRHFVGSSDPLGPEHLHNWLMKSGYEGDRFLTNSLINLYAKAGFFDEAREVFDGMSDKNTVSWTCLISGYANSDKPTKSCELFKSMVSSGIAPTEFAFGSTLRACQVLGRDFLGFGNQIHALVWKSGCVFDSVVCNSLMSMYGSCTLCSMDEALGVFERAPKSNLVSWNSAFSVCSRRGDVVSVFELLSAMQRNCCSSHLRPNEYSFGSLVTATYSSSLTSMYRFYVQLLDQVLSQIIRSGFLNDIYVGSALVTAFARFGSLGKAKDIFSNIPNRNIVSMNGLMVGLIKQKQGEAAFDVFRETSNLVVTNNDSYPILLSACAEFRSPEEGRRKGREIHGIVLKVVANCYKVAIQNGLLNMYAKCGSMEEAHKVFDFMDVQDQISWNSMISGFDQNGLFEEAILSFCRMRTNGILPSNFSLISTLSACSSLKVFEFGKQLHCEVIKVGLDTDISVSNSLLSLYGEFGCLSECWKVFHNTLDHDLVSWNSMIGALSNAGKSISELVSVFSDMMQSGLCPNHITYINILAGLSTLSAWELSSQMHTLTVKHGFSDDNVVENALLSCYAKCENMDACERIFHDMSYRRDDVSWNTMVSGYIQNELLSEAVDFIWFMMHSGQKIDSFTLSIVTSACASLAILQRGMEVHALGIKTLLRSDVVVESSLVDMYAKCGRVDYASKVFQSMPLRNEFTWNSMISGYARHGHAERALKTFQEMQSAGQRPDHVTYVGILSACSHAGLVEEGLEYFKSMSDKYGLIPRMEHYSCMVDMLGRSGKLEKIGDFLRKMPVKPNILVWRTVLAACSRAKDGSGIDLGKQAGKMLLELEPENPVNYVLMSHMYATGGRWDEVGKVRATMRKVPIRKEAGCSWVNLKDGLHIFVAADRSHPETKEIYEKLRIINKKIRDAGYVPQTNFALYDLDVENKEELLSYHSEKIAIAFVITRSSKSPIRIMKNLRVCGDCHSAFEYISKVFERQITLRDSNRFHHFENGKCSCGDFW